MKKLIIYTFVILLFFFGSVYVSHCDIDPRTLVILANSESPRSMEIALYYASKRNVPSRNIIGIPMSQDELIGRDTFANIKDHLLSSLDKKGLTRSVKCILTIYGTPLKLRAVTGPAGKVRFLESEIENLQTTLRGYKKRNETKKAKNISKMLADRKKELKTLQVTQSEASFDSELSLLFWDEYSFERGILNPLHYFYSQHDLKDVEHAQRRRYGLPP
ncbi:MAG: TIGR03790 family protein [Candidatus Tantalella remota]|nr:TIGR03790 family protein [Candidatus Tantalella remota]